jgi:hypothetical protein
MGGNGVDGDGQRPAGLSPRCAPAWDRFADWRALPARLLLLALLALLTASALVPIEARKDGVRTQGFVDNIVASDASARERDHDLALYDKAIARIQRGEHYYDFIVEEHRKAKYPVRPGLAVRLPTLAYIDAWLGVGGQIAAALVLLIAVLVVWWRRLGEEPGGREHRLLAMALLFVGASLGLNRYFFTLHELWAGMLLALSFGLHRPGKWVASLAVAALALAIREHSLPFVLLMAAFALWRRDWKQGAAWGVLALAFLVFLGVHLGMIAAQALPDDQPSESWLALRGLSGWLSNVALSSNLRLLPHWIAGPLVVLMVFGWAGWRSPAGAFGTLLFLGYALAFMIAGRADNYYWGAVIAPPMFIGLAFVSRAFASLGRAAMAK